MPEWIGHCIKGRDPQFATDGPEESQDWPEFQFLAWVDEIAAAEMAECVR